MPPRGDDRDFVMPVPDKATGKCRFFLMRGSVRLADLTLEDAVGQDGKAIFEKIVEAYDYFREMKRGGRIT